MKRGVLLQHGGCRNWEEVEEPPLRRVDHMVMRGLAPKHAFVARTRDVGVESRALNVADRSTKKPRATQAQTTTEDVII